MAFGHAMKIENDGMVIVLKPICIEEVSALSEGFSSLAIVEYTAQIMAQTVENEREWYEKNRKSHDSWLWGIYVDGVFTGVTGLHHLDPIANTCTSGITIFRKEMQGKGVGSAAHLMRTKYAAEELNRFTISSKVRAPNIASLKALEKVGYMVTGKELRTGYRHGKYLDSYVLSWINPRPDVVNLLYPEGIPTEYAEGVEKARIALEKAAKEVVFL